MLGKQDSPKDDLANQSRAQFFTTRLLTICHQRDASLPPHHELAD
ncbi:hypothetical protein AAFX91_13940 [Bradyrhizobium sp. 31Argb]|nr:hypothetical protein [Bradyrhizobium sp. Arg237L]MDI4237583.1 hypothetical protein [Bradyrhizobium sp. Arg237L]